MARRLREGIPWGDGSLIACGIAAGALMTGLGTGQATVGHAAAGGSNQNGFIAPVELPSSVGLGEPTLIHDSANRLFVTAPQSIGNVNAAGGSPLWNSTDGGAHWSTPVRSQECTAFGGGDTDLVADSNDNIYQTDLWLGNSCLSVSSDHGATFSFGNPYGSQLQPGDDRPWLAYNAISNQNYIAYDGVDALHVANTGPIVDPHAGVQAVQDVAAVPESAVNSSNTPDAVRACVCPPGGIAIDNSTGTHKGRVYVSFSYQKGTAIAYSDLSRHVPGVHGQPDVVGADPHPRQRHLGLGVRERVELLADQGGQPRHGVRHVGARPRLQRQREDSPERGDPGLRVQQGRRRHLARSLQALDRGHHRVPDHGRGQPGRDRRRLVRHHRHR